MSAVCTEPCVCVLGVVLYIHAREDEVYIDRGGWEEDRWVGKALMVKVNE